MQLTLQGDLQFGPLLFTQHPHHQDLLSLLNTV